MWRLGVRREHRWGAVFVGALCLTSTTVLIAQAPNLVAAQESPPDATARLIARAQAVAERGQTGRAWAQLERAARRADEEDGRIAIALAESLPTDAAEPSDAWRARAGTARGALETFLAAAPAHPMSAHAARLRAWAAGLAGDHQAAIERAAAAVGLQDRESHALLGRLATLAVLRSDLPAARRALLAAHRAMPQDNGALSDLGAVELALGQPDAASERFARVLGRRPADLDARRDLAGALVAAGRADAAVELLAHATERHPEVAALWLELSHAAREAGEDAVAERAARSAISRLEATDGRGHVALGFALVALQRVDDARAAFEEALRRDARLVRARQGLMALSSGERGEAATSPGLELAAP